MNCAAQKPYYILELRYFSQLKSFLALISSNQLILNELLESTNPERAILNYSVKLDFEYYLNLDNF